jgi:nucleotide-binding universal stress UspA family protein
MQSEGTTTVRPHLLIGRPDAAIVWLAQEMGTDLVVLGSRGLGGISRALIGCVMRTAPSWLCVPKGNE